MEIEGKLRRDFAIGLEKSSRLTSAQARLGLARLGEVHEPERASAKPIL